MLSPVFGDLTVPDQVDRLVRDSRAAAGSIDIWSTMPADLPRRRIGPRQALKRGPLSTDRNVLASVRIISLVLPAMKASRWGSDHKHHKPDSPDAACKSTGLLCRQSSHDRDDGVAHAKDVAARHHRKRRFAWNGA